MRLTKIYHILFVIAKSIAITCFMRILDNKKIPLETSLTKGKVNLCNKKIDSRSKIEGIRPLFFLCELQMDTSLQKQKKESDL